MRDCITPPLVYGGSVDAVCEYVKQKETTPKDKGAVSDSTRSQQGIMLYDMSKRVVGLSLSILYQRIHGCNLKIPLYNFFMHNIRRGTIGELICALKLMKLGVDCSIVNYNEVDIIAEVRGQLLRIQVKSSVVKKDRKTLYYHFSTNSGAEKRPLEASGSDIVALVAADTERVMFKTTASVNKKTARVRADVFRDDNLEEDSWAAAIEAMSLP
tara:strand:+ start:3017 stop:3655 length:639 start_codon:yes stop_codon:yes gene_type:complete